MAASSLGTGPLWAAPSIAEEGAAFSFETLVERARAMAAEGYQPPSGDLPDALEAVDYDEYRDIRYNPDEALWRDLELPFHAQFFHLGAHFNRPVHIFEVVEGMAREVLYDPKLFDFGSNGFHDGLPETLGFAGFRLHHQLNRPDYFDELAVFLGASYFRALGKDQQYGLSARGLAIDTALQKGEEFPYFTAFWLERPADGATEMRLYALLDSPSVAGAYSFLIRPGVNTSIETQAVLFPRAAIEKLGIAPMTSMFFFGEADPSDHDDFRPQVHDSEGLSLWTGAGEWIWRPLVNPRRLRVSSFLDENPRGFGLLQRDRDFSHYLDLEARYDRRPSLWVEPTEDWGRGAVELVEIPTLEEIHDNIVAFWVPEQPVEAGSEWRLSYRLHWCLESPQRPDEAEVWGTRTGDAGVPGVEDEAEGEGGRKFVIDFGGGRLEELPADSPVIAEVTISRGEITTPVAQYNPVMKGWRVFFDLHADGDEVVELRCILKLDSEIISETWSYQWTP
ncbi:glucan biosynthesis protein G [Inquilinus sp. CAU 1745]|uniref:glucan biosynthesis protein n=1 Tax=Inquilinus sp. CAU 1745 TaxID=3140369 RepID=UPI00325BC40E